MATWGPRLRQCNLIVFDLDVGFLSHDLLGLLGAERDLVDSSKMGILGIEITPRMLPLVGTYMNQSYLQLPLSHYKYIYIYTVQLALFQGSLAKCSWLLFYRRMKIGFLLTSGFTEQWPSQIWSHSVATLWKTWRCSQWQYICSQSIIMSHWYDNFRLAMYRKTAYHAGCKMPILISLNFNCW